VEARCRLKSWPASSLYPAAVKDNDADEAKIERV
jgi:hypothetical protein